MECLSFEFECPLLLCDRHHCLLTHILFEIHMCQLKFWNGILARVLAFGALIRCEGWVASIMHISFQIILFFRCMRLCTIVNPIDHLSKIILHPIMNPWTHCYATCMGIVNSFRMQECWNWTNAFWLSLTVFCLHMRVLLKYVTHQNTSVQNLSWLTIHMQNLIQKYSWTLKVQWFFKMNISHIKNVLFQQLPFQNIGVQCSTGNTMSVIWPPVEPSERVPCVQHIYVLICRSYLIMTIFRYNQTGSVFTFQLSVIFTCAYWSSFKGNKTSAWRCVHIGIDQISRNENWIHPSTTFQRWTSGNVRMTVSSLKHHVMIVQQVE